MKHMLYRSAMGLGVAFCLASTALAAGGPPSSQPKEDKGQTCINLKPIDQTYVINDFVIVYHTRGGKLYRNTLPRKCNTLGQQGAFSTLLTTPYRLCRGDILTVSLTQNNCALGDFHEISEQDFKRLQYAEYLVRQKEKEIKETKDKGRDKN